MSSFLIYSFLRCFIRVSSCTYWATVLIPIQYHIQICTSRACNWAGYACIPHRTRAGGNEQGCRQGSMDRRCGRQMWTGGVDRGTWMWVYGQIWGVVDRGVHPWHTHRHTHTHTHTQPETATKAGGTHPTGMHTCFKRFCNMCIFCRNSEDFVLYH